MLLFISLFADTFAYHLIENVTLHIFIFSTPVKFKSSQANGTKLDSLDSL